MRMKVIKIIFILFFFSTNLEIKAQGDSLTSKQVQKRVTAVAIGGGAVYSGLAIGLWKAWYSQYPFQKFHTFNDNNEWLQMDKVGHAYSCYAEGVNGIDLMRWTGMERKKAILIGGSVGLAVQTIVETLDGFSQGWGFSFSDMGANLFGTTLGISQALMWNEQRIQLRYSFHQSDYRTLRPNLLGNNFYSQFLKDYNGQTYWVSVNPNSFSKSVTKFPKWLNLAFGYGANGMLTGKPGNIWTDASGTIHDYSNIKRYRQFYLSPDIDLNKIEFLQRTKFTRGMCRVVSFFKFPLPAIAYDKVQGFKFWPLYF